MHHISFDYQLSEKRTFNRNRAGDAIKPPENCTECLWFAIILSCLNTCYLLKLCMICCSRVALRSCQNANNCKSPHCDSFKRASLGIRLLNALRSKSNLMNLLIAVLLLLCGSSLPDGRYWNMFTSRFFNKHKLSSRFKYWRFVDFPQIGNSMLRWILFGFSMLFRSAQGSSILAYSRSFRCFRCSSAATFNLQQWIILSLVVIFRCLSRRFRFFGACCTQTSQQSNNYDYDAKSCSISCRRQRRGKHFRLPKPNYDRTARN